MKLQNIHNQGNEIYLFLRNEDGSQEIKKIKDFMAYYYNECDDGPFKGFDGTPLQRLYASHPGEIKKRRGPNSWEADVLFNTRYITDKIDKIDRSPTRWCFFDIEVKADDGFPDPEKAKHPITTIVAYDNYDDQYHTFFINDLESERAVIERFIIYLQKRKPDLLGIWNGHDFDMPYLINRTKKILKKDFSKEISPIKQNRFCQRAMDGYFYPAGISVLDLMCCYHKFTRGSKPSYALDRVAQDELNYKAWGETDFGGDLEHAKEKCVEDVSKMIDLEKKCNIINFFDAQRLFSKCQWEELPSKKEGYQFRSYNSKIWDNLFLQLAKEKNVVLPSKPNYTDEERHKFKHDVRFKKDGAYRELFKTGRFFGEVTSYDLSECYPRAVIDFALDKTNLFFREDLPDFFPSDQEVAEQIEKGHDVWGGTKWGQYLDKNNIIPIPVYYRQSIEELKKDKRYKNHWPEEEITPLRWVCYFKQNKNAIKPASFDKPLKWKHELKKELKETKEKETMQSVYDAGKAIVNSGFGVNGNPYTRLFCLEEFNTNTLLPRDMLNFINKELKKRGYQIVFIDTDGILIQTRKDISGLLNELIQEWAISKYNNKEVTIKFEYEGRYKRLYVGTNCRYMGYKEGEDTPKIKGLESKRSDSSAYMKKFLSKVYDLVLDEKQTKENIINFVKKEIHDFEKQELSEIAVPKKLSKPISKYKSNSYHVRALKNANEWFGLEKDVNEPYYIIYLNKDQKDNLVAFDEKTKHKVTGVDYNKMLQKNIFNKVENVFEALGWGIEYLELCEEFHQKPSMAVRRKMVKIYEDTDDYEDLKKRWKVKEKKSRKS